MSMASNRSPSITRTSPPEPIYTLIDKTSNGEAISVTGIVHGHTTKVVVPGKTGVLLYPTQCFEFRGLQDKAENIAWVALIQALRHNPMYHPDLQVGLVVDSDFTYLELYNNRQIPVYNQFHLPGNMKFTYASSEVRDH
jgi:hypothetical protein